MHGEVVTTRTGTPTEPATALTNREIKTRIWRNARTIDGYFLDISKTAGTTEQQHLKILDQQYKASNFLGKSAQRFIEVYPTTDIVDRFLAECVLYESENFKTQLFPYKTAVDEEGELIQSALTDIPFLPQTQLLQELSRAIGIFEIFLDLGLYYEQSMGWFMGSGYAILQQQPNVTYPTPHHSIITWQTDTQDEEFCHATFPDMATKRTIPSLNTFFFFKLFLLIAPCK
ncbi:hypothetical protein MAM1_0799c11252 [Mucor ambiguus]|uniref:Uncharacterized protein n=1 Tax=Mucor ambiguus TaxID=91626 RepID=A0A0C9MLI9_9FUNG|nr:hypothetical protein MAM1_0799c11252 [Mucor ambiguus]